MLPIGIRGVQTVKVAPENTAAALGSGQLEVFATPAMAALMEQTAWTSVQPFLEEGEGTVGTRLELEHLSATPVGMEVRCESELTATRGRTLTFNVQCFDQKGLVGKGVHQRVVIDNARFMARAQAKKDESM